MNLTRMRKRIREKLESLYKAYLNPVLLDENGKPLIFYDEWFERRISEEEFSKLRELQHRAYGIGLVTGIRGLVCLELMDSLTPDFYENTISTLFMTKKVDRRSRLPIGYYVFFFVPMGVINRLSVINKSKVVILHKRDVVPVYAVTKDWLVVSCSLINPWETYYDFTPNLERINSALELLGLRLKV